MSTVFCPLEKKVSVSGLVLSSQRLTSSDLVASANRPTPHTAQLSETETETETESVSETELKGEIVSQAM